MSFDIKLPNISAPTTSGQIEQIRGYLYQLADQLKWALNSISAGGGELQAITNTTTNTVKQLSEGEAQATFNSIKSLIIKSADIVNAYYDEIVNRYHGEFVAQSDFGAFVELTERTEVNNSTEMEDLYNHMQEIISDIGNIKSRLIEVNARIKSGLLYYDAEGVPIYGLEIGQVNNVDGVEVFNKYARFTSDRLTFYDKNDTEVAYISDYKLCITNAQITGTLTLGRFDFDTSDGLAIKWV